MAQLGELSGSRPDAGCWIKLFLVECGGTHCFSQKYQVLLQAEMWHTDMPYVSFNCAKSKWEWNSEILKNFILWKGGGLEIATLSML